MKRQYIIVGRRKGDSKWLEFDCNALPLTYGGSRCTRRPGMDNLAVAIEGMKERQPDWQFKAVRV